MDLSLVKLSISQVAVKKYWKERKKNTEKKGKWERGKRKEEEKQ